MTSQGSQIGVPCSPQKEPRLTTDVQIQPPALWDSTFLLSKPLLCGPIIAAPLANYNSQHQHVSEGFKGHNCFFKERFTSFQTQTLFKNEATKYFAIFEIYILLLFMYFFKIWRPVFKKKFRNIVRQEDIDHLWLIPYKYISKAFWEEKKTNKPHSIHKINIINRRKKKGT